MRSRGCAAVVIAVLRRICAPALLLCLAVPAQAADCSVGPAQREAMLALPFQQFDQQADSGWRPLYAGHCYAAAAGLLEAYMARHPDTGRKQYMLPFHTGQMYALAGDYDAAIGWMRKGYSDRRSPYIDWNAFVDANIAFLQHDRGALLGERAAIARERPMPNQPGAPAWAVGKKMNLDVVDGFIACFDQPYEQAYGDACREQGAGQPRNTESTGLQ